ncbi:hypothetical protein SELA5_p0092 (plasmid) [Salmonella enterica subsp. enterica serovar Enteritidis str. LA5]|nr:hypothetical protein SELA5_p0092 [Salmonella enterica subsp. enterica serovar Enteritidis str. LA5]
MGCGAFGGEDGKFVEYGAGVG